MRAALAHGISLILLVVISGGAHAQDCDECAEAPCNAAEEGRCCADLSGNGIVDDDDVTLFYTYYISYQEDCSQGCSCPADLNWDGTVDDCDLCILDEEYGNCTGYSLFPLETWNLLCYDANCDDPNCLNNPESPDSCCPTHCTPCLANKGCLPLSPPCMTFQDLDGDGWPDALVWAAEPIIPTNTRRRVFWNDFGSGNERWIEGCILDDITTLDTSGRGFTAGDFNEDGWPDFLTQPSGLMRILVSLRQGQRCGSSVGCGAEAGQCTGSDGANFVQVQGCYGISLSGGTVETFGWGDADGDLDLDAFLSYEGSTWYLKNLGANDPNCDPNGSESPAIYRLTQVDPRICDAGRVDVMALQFAGGSYTSPVKVRLSRKEN